MPHIYLVSDRTRPWPILSKGRRRPPGSVRVELVAESDDEAAAWEAFECLVEGVPAAGSLPARPTKPINDLPNRPSVAESGQLAPR